MKVKRIVANIETEDVAAARSFYQDVLGLDILMDHGWIATYGSSEEMSVQVSFARQGGSGTPVPDLSIEVDDVDAALEAHEGGGFAIEYGPADEPWGVRRFYVRDPFGKLVNILDALGQALGRYAGGTPPPHPASASLGHPLPVGERRRFDVMRHHLLSSLVPTVTISSPRRGEGGRAKRRPGEGEDTAAA